MYILLSAVFILMLESRKINYTLKQKGIDRYMYTHDQRSIIHNCSRVEATQVSINRQIDK